MSSQEDVPVRAVRRETVERSAMARMPMGPRREALACWRFSLTVRGYDDNVIVEIPREGDDFARFRRHSGAPP